MKRMCWPCCLQALESLLLRLHVALSRINFTKWLSLCSFSLKSITFDQTEEARPLDLQKDEKDVLAMLPTGFGKSSAAAFDQTEEANPKSQNV